MTLTFIPKIAFSDFVAAGRSVILIFYETWITLMASSIQYWVKGNCK